MKPDERAELFNQYLAIKATLSSNYEAGQTNPDAWNQYQADRVRLKELGRLFEPRTGDPMTMRDEQKQKDRLHAQAEQTAAALFSREIRAEVGSPKAKRLRILANRAAKRAERRYQASLKAYNAALDS